MSKQWMALTSLAWCITSFVQLNVLASNNLTIEPVKNYAGNDACAANLVGIFKFVELSSGNCRYRVSSRANTTVSFWHIKATGIKNQGMAAFFTSEDLSKPLPWTYAPGQASVDITVPAAAAPNGIFMLLDTFNNATLYVEISSLTSCKEQEVEVLYHHTPLEQLPYFSSCIPAPSINRDTANTSGFTLSLVFPFSELPPSFWSTGFHASLRNLYVAPDDLPAGRYALDLFTSTPGASILSNWTSPGGEWSRTSTSQFIAISSNGSNISVSFGVPPRNIAGGMPDFTVELLGPAPQGVKTTPEMPAAPQAPPGCAPLASPMVVLDSFFQADYDNLRVLSCSFFLPLVNTPNGSAASAFSLRPFDLDGYSFITVYSDTQLLPLRNIRTNSLFVLDAASFTNYGGITITVHVAGTYSPFSLVVAVAATCLPPQLPMGFVSYEDAIVKGGMKHVEAPLVVCSNPVVEFLDIAGSSNISCSLSINMSRLPAYYVPAFVAIFKPNLTSLMPGRCYSVNISNSNISAEVEMYLLFNAARRIKRSLLQGGTGQPERRHTGLDPLQLAGPGSTMPKQDARPGLHTSNPIDKITVAARLTLFLSGELAFPFGAANTYAVSSSILCVPSLGVKEALLVISINNSAEMPPPSLMLKTLDLGLLPLNSSADAAAHRDKAPGSEGKNVEAPKTSVRLTGSPLLVLCASTAAMLLISLLLS